MTVQRCRLPRAVALGVLLFLLAGPPRVNATAAWLAIAPAQYAGEFERLAAMHAAEGLSAEVVTLEEVWAQDLSGGDAPARLREYLRAAAASGTRYVLLGGDGCQVPARHLQWHSPYWPDEMQSDLYLACFVGEWDVDGDGTYDDYIPNPLLKPTLAIGRAPVGDVSQARNFVDKILAFTADADQPYRRRALFADVVLSPMFWVPGQTVVTDWARYAQEQVLPSFEAAGVEVVRLYQNHTAHEGALPLSSAALLARLGTGDHGLVRVACRASSRVWDLGWDGEVAEVLDLEDAKDLTTNGHAFFLQAIAAHGADHGDSTGLLVPLLRAPIGGCVGAVGFAATPYFVGSTRLQRDFWAAALDTAPRAGDAWAAAVTAGYGEYWSIASFTLLGDPALVVAPAAAPRPPATGEVSLEAAPNPFNPLTRIRFDLARSGPARLEIFDLSGKQVAVLLDGRLPAGGHDVIWNGSDDARRAVAAGVYFARLTTAAGVSSRRLVLLK